MFFAKLDFLGKFENFSNQNENKATFSRNNSWQTCLIKRAVFEFALSFARRLFPRQRREHLGGCRLWVVSEEGKETFYYPLQSRFIRAPRAAPRWSLESEIIPRRAEKETSPSFSLQVDRHRQKKTNSLKRKKLGLSGGNIQKRRRRRRRRQRRRKC